MKKEFTPIHYDVVHSDADLECILQLQHSNLPVNISKEESLKEGYVTLQHDLELLKRLNTPFPHIVARDQGKVVGYVLVMLRTMAHSIDLLKSMFIEIDKIIYKGEKLGVQKYFVMGQVCIDKKYRGRGIFAGLYEEMGKRMHNHFDYIITEISKSNPRSLRAHEKVGFKTIKEYQSDGVDWVIVLLDI